MQLCSLSLPSTPQRIFTQIQHLEILGRRANTIHCKRDEQTFSHTKARSPCPQPFHFPLPPDKIQLGPVSLSAEPSPASLPCWTPFHTSNEKSGVVLSRCLTPRLGTHAPTLKLQRRTILTLGEASLLPQEETRPRHWPAESSCCPTDWRTSHLPF